MSQSDDRHSGHDPLAFLAGGGEMGERTRAFDWPQTPVGPAADWPQGLKTVVRIMLDSRYAMWLGWGPEFTFFYNDAYAKMTLGPKHPWALGRSAREVWSEIWADIGPRAESVLRTGQATWDEGLLLFLERRGFPEETYHTFSYSPVPDDRGGVGGMLCVVTEDTERTIGERRLRTLRELAARTTDEAKSVEDACQTAAHTLAGNPQDVPFALLYLLDAEGRRVTLAGLTGVGRGAPTSPAAAELQSGAGPWPFRQVAETGKAVEVHDLPKKFGPLPGGAWPEPAQQAVVLPMAKPGQARLAGFVVAGVSPRRPLDDGYRGFLDLLAGQVAIAVANARAYEEEKRRAEALAELDRAKTAFFSNVSHEFRTPLTLMLGPVEDLLAKSHTDLSPAAAGQLEVVNRNGLRLLRLVNTLLDFSRIEAGRVRAVYQPTDLAAFTAELASVFRAAVEKAGLRLVVDCPPLSGPVFVDREMWEKVVLNLLSNAFKFTFTGEIAVSLRPAGSAAELRVRDTGTGIPAEEMPKLFERFHRVQNARARTHEGSGIGLALVQELVKLHGGSIAAESAVGKGTTFTVSVPLGSAHLPPDQLGEGRSPAAAGTGASPYVEEALRWLPDEAEAGSDSRPELPTYHEPLPTPYVQPGQDPSDDRPRVLVADDNADMRQYVARLLAEHYRIEAVPDGEAALQAARDRPPDLILTDVMMPRLDGFGLLRELRADPRTSGLPVILLSARAGEESRVEGMEAGADDYLVKPFSARELLARVTAHLQMARMRREAGESLRAGEERLRMALTAARMVAWQWDPAEDKVVVSDNAADVFGLPPGSTLEASAQGFALVHPDDVDRHRATVQKAVQECGGYLSQFRMIRPDDGAVIWLEERGHAAREGPEKAVRLVGVVLDVTDRKRAEEALRESEARFRTFADTAPAMLWVTEPDASCSFLSRGWYELTGQTEATGLGFGWLGAVHPDDRAASRDTFLAANARHEPFALEHRLRRADGTYGWVIDAGRPRLGPGGKFLGYIGSVIDITDRKRTEERLDLVVNSSQVGLWYCDLPFDKLDWNAKVKEHFGLPAGADVTIDTFYQRLHPDDRGRTRQAIERSIRDRTDYDIEYRTVGLDGRERWVRAIGRVSYDDAGAPARFDGITVDVTERVRQAEALREADRRKDEFLATLAHELRNPLAPLRNGLQVMKLARGDAEAVEQSRAMMERQLGQMVHLIDDLLDVSRISRGKVELKKERVELAKAVQQAVETSRPLIEAGGHDLTIHLPPQPIFVDADVTRLAQVISNLLNNAAKYTERGGHVTLAAERRGGDAVVSVRDTGVGIPAHMLPNVFDMFTQVDRSLEKSQGGLGIGLSLVKGLVEMHGGTVEARSGGHGMGSEFVVRLPVALSVVGRRREGGEPVGPTARRRVLVVDDNRDAATSLAMMLQLMGNDTQSAHDGLEALDVAAAFRPDVVLLDIGMPKLNGYDAARRIREQPWGRNTLLVALTGWGQQEDKRRSQEAGFDHHLVKPVDPVVLEKLLAGLQTATG